MKLAAVVVLACACLLSVSSVAAQTAAIAHAAIRSGSVAGSVFFAQADSTSAVTVKVHLTSGFAVNTTYHLFVHTYGDLYSSTSHGACFSGQTASFASFMTDESAEFVSETSSSAISLQGSSSILGRAVALYASLSADSCTIAEAASPVGRGVIGAAWPGVGVANQNAASAPLSTSPVSAFCEIIGTTGTYGDNSGISGYVYFEALADGTTNVAVWISGATISNGLHAIHVHEYGDLSLTNATSMNLHWNPYGKYHGAPTAEWKHAGDMGNWTASSNTIYGVQSFTQLTMLGSASFIGRGVVLHTLKDDGNPTNSSTSVGAAGGRLARGVIGVSARAVPYPSSSSASSTTGTETGSTTGTVASSSGSSGNTTASTGVNGAAQATVSVAALLVAAVAALVVA